MRMSQRKPTGILGALIMGCSAVTLSVPALAQAPAISTKPAAATTAGGTMERLQGVWIEGPGFDIKYGIAYDACARRCLETKSCVMIEYYRPEKKCNMYDTERPRIKGGSSDVAIRR